MITSAAAGRPPTRQGQGVVSTEGEMVQASAWGTYCYAIATVDREHTLEGGFLHTPFAYFFNFCCKTCGGMWAMMGGGMEGGSEGMRQM